MAEHELRGPVAALALAAEASARRPGRTAAAAVEAQLERAKLGLADLAAARSGRRSPPLVARVPVRQVAERVAAAGNVEVDWRAGPARVDADPARISQALGNLVSNALEHGGGRVELRGVRDADRVRIELSDSGPGFGAAPEPDWHTGRGRGLAIAARAVEEAGGQLRIASSEDGATVAVELPLADA